ncbi:MAG TPA: DUF4397 domain-containing protein [Jatrophihabitans sp.]
MPIRSNRPTTAGAVGLIAMASVAFGLIGTGPAAAAPSDPALIRVAHFSPDTPGVDVYLTAFSGGTASLWVPNAAYGGVSAYKQVAPGIYVVSMRPHGAAPSTPAAVSWNIQVAGGQAYTAAAIGSNSSLKTIVLHDDLTLPPNGTGRVRVVQAASRAPTANIAAVGGVTVAQAVPFASTTGYTSVPAGSWTLRATDPGSPAVSTTAQLSVASGTVLSILLLDAKGGGITMRSVLDAASAGTPPSGSVPGGGGGTAVGSNGATVAAVDAALAVLVLGSATVLYRRRRLV